ncbi:hypothetical protein EVAR_68968_1 [Eumeta japonica]|uniref:Uncharacterized protein n=1 Tax=Eumeta variegata TaxID=151549 RepID=A0A4C2A7A9_EUMVA|nr:hypothetical protein EVAR_68968_1 [Eumeta japonica]
MRPGGRLAPAHGPRSPPLRHTVPNSRVFTRFHFERNGKRSRAERRGPGEGRRSASGAAFDIITRLRDTKRGSYENAPPHPVKPDDRHVIRVRTQSSVNRNAADGRVASKV